MDLGIPQLQGLETPLLRQQPFGDGVASSISSASAGPSSNKKNDKSLQQQHQQQQQQPHLQQQKPVVNSRSVEAIEARHLQQLQQQQQKLLQQRRELHQQQVEQSMPMPQPSQPPARLQPLQGVARGPGSGSGTGTGGGGFGKFWDDLEAVPPRVPEADITMLPSMSSSHSTGPAAGGPAQASPKHGRRVSWGDIEDEGSPGTGSPELSSPLPMAPPQGLGGPVPRRSQWPADSPELVPRPMPHPRAPPAPKAMPEARAPAPPAHSRGPPGSMQRSSSQQLLREPRTFQGVRLPSLSPEPRGAAASGSTSAQSSSTHDNNQSKRLGRHGSNSRSAPHLRSQSSDIPKALAAAAAATRGGPELSSAHQLQGILSQLQNAQAGGKAVYDLNRNRPPPPPRSVPTRRPLDRAIF